MKRMSPFFIVLCFCASCGSSGGKDDPDWGHVGDDDVAGTGDTAQDNSCKTSEDCSGATPFCHVGEKICVECTKDEQCPTERPYCHANLHACVECVMDNACSAGQHCLDGQCSDKTCWPDTGVCVGNSVHTCSPDGSDPHFKVEDCGEKTCYEGKCLECVPDNKACKGNQVIQCSHDGEEYDILQDCGNKECIGSQCVFCYPGNKKCEGNISMVCGQDGEHWEVNQSCDESGFTCVNGICISPCAGDIKQNTNAGCEFYAVDLHNAREETYMGVYDAQNAQFAVIASNTSDKSVATVTVWRPDGQKEEQQIAPSSLGKFLLPPDWGIGGTEVGNKAFRITSTLPVTVYQFNPLSNEDVFSNDASVLLPTPGIGKEYWVMSYQGETYASYFAIVGVTSVPVEVEFKVTCRTLAGGGIPALSAGQSHKMTINQGEVIAVEAAPEAGLDLTGSHVVANGPVMVFGGHVAAATADRCCADHLEQQLTAVNTWGSKYVITKTWTRWKEKDYVRILAAKDGTSVTINPPVATVPVLNAGQFFTFKTDKDLEIISSDQTKPLLVGQYLASSYEILGEGYSVDSCYDDTDCPPTYTCDYYYGQCVGASCSSVSQCPSGHTCDDTGYCAPIGDPTFILAVPAEQFMDSYVFLTPDAYLQDYLNIIAPLTAQTVVLDGNQIPPAQFSSIGTSGFGVYRTKVGDGVHQIWSDKKINIVVYGYDDDVSYGYPGGLGLLELH